VGDAIFEKTQHCFIVRGVREMLKYGSVRLGTTACLHTFIVTRDPTTSNYEYHSFNMRIIGLQ
jgi:hypothetical protein